MAKVIAVTNQKGGIGKTSTVLALGAGLKERGSKVLYVDLDPQCNLSFALDAQKSPRSAFGLLTEENEAWEAVQLRDTGGVIAASPNLAGIDLLLSGTTGREYRLKKALETVEGASDYILIDTPPSLGTLTVNALAAADYVIVPAQAEVFSIQGISQLAQSIDSVKEYCNPDLVVLGILLTRHNERTNLAQDLSELMELQAKTLGTELFETTIREAVAVREAQAMQVSIFEHAPKSNVAKDYKAFITEVLERIESYEQKKEV